MRETWEETGLLVVPKRLTAIYGGPEFLVRYPNGDEVQYVIAAFECSVRSGTLRGESDETDEVSYFTHTEAAKLQLSSWLRSALDSVYSRDEPFATPTWTPPASCD